MPNALADPRLELHNGQGDLIASNDNWKSAQRTAIEKTGIPPAEAREAALLTTLSPGNYTAVLRGAAGGVGVGLVEAYQLEEP